MSSKLEKHAGWESSLRGALYRQLLVGQKPLPSSVRLDGQTAIVTGSNGGLGLESGRQLLALGVSHLIMAVRSQAKGDVAASGLRNQFPQSRIDVSILDMADYDSITRFAKSCENLDRIDIVILNAGIQPENFELNVKTGHETGYQTNVLSTALLTILLVPIMKAKSRKAETGKPPVLSVIGSDSMYMSKFKPTGPITSLFDDGTHFVRFDWYGNGKLMLMMFIAKLAEQVPAEDVLINVCNPGLTAGTKLGGYSDRPGFFFQRVLPLIVGMVGRSLPVGASTYIHAVAGEGEESHGSFVSEWEIKP